MSDLSKFYADVQRILKHERANNAGQHDSLKAARAVSKHFIHCSGNLGELPELISNYWYKKYIDGSKNRAIEPSKESIEWLERALALLLGEFDSEMDFSPEDWSELATITKYEAQDLPIDVLSEIMSTFVSRNII